MTKIGLIQFLLLFLISAAWGQKVKYKDIYALLSTKQYEQAEPFLKDYLREKTDQPSGYLFMGMIFQEKALKDDVLKQTQAAIANMDSAILFYTKATETIDEREVRKRDDYYAGYSRRDLRTGQFGVKLSDIQFDISKRIESMKERISQVRMVSHYFTEADTAYRRANALFLALKNQFSTEHQLYLRAGDETLSALTTLGLRFDSCRKAFEHYKSASQLLGKTGYNQQVSLKELTDFAQQGGDEVDFLKDEITLWDYGTFSKEAREVIEKEILPMRKHLVSYDMEISKLREKLAADSVSVRSDLTKLIDKLLYEQLRKFDATPLPMLVFAMKTTELEYRSALLEHKPYRDSANVHLQLDMVRDELTLLGKLDSTAALADAGGIAERALDYADFVRETYGDVSALEQYVAGLREFGSVQQAEKQRQLDHWLKALNYIVDGSDSIPLSADIVGVWSPLLTTPEKFTVGITARDSTQLQGYFYTINASRTPDVKAFFPLDSKLFQRAGDSTTHALAHSDGGDQIFYVLVYSGNAVKEKYPATLAKIYRSDGLAWKKELPLQFKPNEMHLATDGADLVISDGILELVVDKQGEVVR